MYDPEFEDNIEIALLAFIIVMAILFALLVH